MDSRRCHILAARSHFRIQNSCQINAFQRAQLRAPWCSSQAPAQSPFQLTLAPFHRLEFLLGTLHEAISPVRSRIVHPGSHSPVLK